MGFLDNSSVTVDAILTKRGREILSEGGDLNIVKFALSDEEVDYTLYNLSLHHLMQISLYLNHHRVKASHDLLL